MNVVVLFEKKGDIFGKLAEQWPVSRVRVDPAFR